MRLWRLKHVRKPNRFQVRRIERDTVRTSYIKSKPIYEDRARLLQQIPGFWSRVLQSEDVPAAIESSIHACDLPALDAITAIEVTRFEVDQDPEEGDPRSCKLIFEFGPNGALEDKVLEKTFRHIRTDEGRTGLVSEPVKITYSKTPLGDEVAESVARQESFFAFFGYRGSPEKADEDGLETGKGNSKSDTLESGDLKALVQRIVAPDDDEDEAFTQDAFQEIAIALSEDIYPGALKYFGILP